MAETNFWLETGMTQSSPAGTAIPILGIHWSSGSIASNIGVGSLLGGPSILTGAGTSWTLARTAGYWIKTEGGNKYKIVKFISNVQIEIDRNAALESTATYQIYRRPTTSEVYIQSNYSNTSKNIYFGIDGQVFATADPVRGLSVSTTEGFKTIKVNLANTDVWIDVGTDQDIVEWGLLKAEE